jgi:hypothetical protein
MKNAITQLIGKMTPQEQAEVETFAAFVLARRSLQTIQIMNDDISTKELTKLISESGGFHWLGAKEEDIYSLEDGEEAAWENLS